MGARQLFTATTMTGYYGAWNNPALEEGEYTTWRKSDGTNHEDSALDIVA